MSCLNSVTEFLYSETTPTGTLTYCYLSYFESRILINIGSIESLRFGGKTKLYLRVDRDRFCS